VVGIRGLIHLPHIHALLKFLDTPQKHWSTTIASTVLASVKALYFLHRVRFGGLPTLDLLEDGLITYLGDSDDTDSSDRDSPQSNGNSRKRVNDLGQGPGISGRLFQISKTRQKKKIRISNPLVSSSGSSPQILGPQLTSSASTSQSVPSISSPTSLIRRKVTRRTNLAHSGTSQSCTSMCEQAPSGNTKNPPVKNSTLQCPLRNVHLTPNGGSTQKQMNLVNQHECNGMLSSKIVYSTRMTHY
jgi:hypothetical protein